MKKILIIAAFFAISGLAISPVFAKVWSESATPIIANGNNKERTVSLKNATENEMPLSCEVLFTFVKWGIQHPDQYLWIADFNKDKIVNPIDLAIFMRNRNIDNWCAKQLGWY